MQLHGLNWFEIPVADFDRAKKFYSTIFGFEMPEMMMGPNRMGFFLFDMQNAGVGGAIVKGEGYFPDDKGSLIYLNAGDELDIILSKVGSAGGKIVQDKLAVSPDAQMGWFAFIRDTEGNKVALHSPQ